MSWLQGAYLTLVFNTGIFSGTSVDFLNPFCKAQQGEVTTKRLRLWSRQSGSFQACFGGL